MISFAPFPGGFIADFEWKYKIVRIKNDNTIEKKLRRYGVELEEST